MIGAIIVITGMALFDLFLVLACAKLEEEEKRWERHWRDGDWGDDDGTDRYD